MHSQTDRQHTDQTRRSILKHAAMGATAVGLGLPAMTGVVGATNGVQRISESLAGVDFFVPCAGETLRATQGTLEIFVLEHTNATGKVHFVLQQTLRNTKLVGLTSGTTYRAVGGAMGSTQARPPYPVVISGLIRERWISPGPEPDILFDFTYKLRVNANGDVVLESFEDTTECR
jgi:hypothetical protein